MTTHTHTRALEVDRAGEWLKPFAKTLSLFITGNLQTRRKSVSELTASHGVTTKMIQQAMMGTKITTVLVNRLMAAAVSLGGEVEVQYGFPYNAILQRTGKTVNLKQTALDIGKEARKEIRYRKIDVRTVQMELDIPISVAISLYNGSRAFSSLINMLVMASKLGARCRIEIN